MIAWVLYTLVVSVLVVLGARAAESIGRSLTYPVRWVWAGAFALLLALATLAPLRAADHTGQVLLPATAREVAGPVEVSTPSWTARIESRVAGIGHDFNDRVERVTRNLEQRLPPRAPVIALILTSFVSVIVLAIFAVVQLRFGRARRAWPLTDVQGVRVRVAPNVGPVVIGVVRPEIVIPRWLLAREAHEQQMVVAHEAEHVRARDTLLLGAGCFVVAAMPWNPLAWYMLSRLRLAVELDCDARVLNSGAAPFSYGSLLIDVAANNSGARLGVPALADDSSHLHQRIMAMNAERPRFAVMRGSVFAALTLVALLAACEARMPTSAEVDQMDAASAERAATKLSLLKAGDSTAYFVDGVKLSASKATEIAPDKIASIEVKKSPGGRGAVLIYTKAAKGLVSQADSAARVAVEVPTDSQRLATDRIRIAYDSGNSGTNTLLVRRKPADGDTTRSGALRLDGIVGKTGAKPLVYIDGTKVNSDAINTLQPNEIESIEVIKGPSAAAYVNDPEAANGVIVIKTKKAKT